MNIALSLGGNIGNVCQHFVDAVKQLADNNFKLTNLSSAYVTEAVGCKPGTPDFINAALTGEWFHSAETLFSLCKSIEVRSGRPENHEAYGNRTLDLDIIFFGNQIIKNELLTVPHQEAYNRLFVLIPLCEIANDWIFPDTNQSVEKVLAHKKNCPEYHKIISTKIPLTII